MIDKWMELPADETLLEEWMWLPVNEILLGDS